jgi:hypothetical protein
LRCWLMMLTRLGSLAENGETSLSLLVKIPGRVNVYSLRTGKWAIKIVYLAMKNCDFA